MRTIFTALYHSVRFRLASIFLVLSFLVGLSAFTGAQIVAARNATKLLIDTANQQSAAAYRLATLARKLASATNGTEAQNITALIDEGIASFDADEQLLRNGDPSKGVSPVTNIQALEALKRADTQWGRYRSLLTEYKANPQQTSLLLQIDTQATSVFVYTTEFAAALDLLVNVSFRQAEQTFIIVAFGTLILLGLSFIQLYQIVRSLNRLTVAAQAYAKGQYDVIVGTQRLDEFAQVGNVLNNMAVSVASRETELRDLNQVLEKRIEERTEDLRVARDEALAASELAQETTRLKSEFLSTMSHELRTPLNAIEGFTGILLNKMGGTSYNDKSEDLLNRIRSNSKRLLQLINDFLDLSRIEAGRLELANLAFSPMQLARRWQNEIGVLAEKKGLQFEVSLDPTLPETIYGDEEAISKVAINLLGNAIKFTEQGQVTLVVERNDSQWEIVVQDTGIGIPPHAREFIFEEFRQVDQSSKRKYGGTGLGLAIVHKYIRAMGGSVNVSSELGKGSTFTVTLPYKASA